MSKKRRERYKRQKRRKEERHIMHQFQLCKTVNKKEINARKNAARVNLQDMEDMSSPPIDYTKEENVDGQSKRTAFFIEPKSLPMK